MCRVTLILLNDLGISFSFNNNSRKKKRQKEGSMKDLISQVFVEKKKCMATQVLTREELSCLIERKNRCGKAKNKTSAKAHSLW